MAKKSLSGQSLSVGVEKIKSIVYKKRKKCKPCPSGLPWGYWLAVGMSSFFYFWVLDECAGGSGLKLRGFCNSEKETGRERTAKQPTTRKGGTMSCLSLGLSLGFSQIWNGKGQVLNIVAVGSGDPKTNAISSPRQIGSRARWLLRGYFSVTWPRFILFLLVIHRRGWSLEFRSLSIVFKSRHSQTWDDKKGRFTAHYPDIWSRLGLILS